MVSTKLLMLVDISAQSLTKVSHTPLNSGNNYTQIHMTHMLTISWVDLMLLKPHGEWWTKPPVLCPHNKCNNLTSGKISKRDWVMPVMYLTRSPKPEDKSAVSSTKLPHKPWVSGHNFTQNHTVNTLETSAPDSMPQSKSGEWLTKLDLPCKTESSHPVCTCQASTSTNNNNCNNSDSSMMSRTSEDKLVKLESKSPVPSQDGSHKPPKPGRNCTQNHSINTETWSLIAPPKELIFQTQSSTTLDKWNNSNKCNNFSSERLKMQFLKEPTLSMDILVQLTELSPHQDNNSQQFQPSHSTNKTCFSEHGFSWLPKLIIFDWQKPLCKI
jgi:hypothetical protein